MRKRLRRIKGTLINVLYTNEELLEYLIGERVISDVDYQNISAELTLNQKNSRLIDIIMRGSERDFQSFKDVLIYVNQGHVTRYIEKGLLSARLSEQIGIGFDGWRHLSELLTPLRLIAAVALTCCFVDCI